MKFKFQNFIFGLIAALVVVPPLKTSAFALFGPVQPWMQASNSVIWPGDIGGPMDIGSGYRWNLPVVTYGFDQSFLHFFGTNGVAAVEGAIKFLNDLPPASQMVLTNYPLASSQVSPASGASSLFDLRSQALSFLLAQLGLAPPTRNIFVIHQWDPILLTYNDLLSPWYFYDNINDPTFYLIRHLNFDPLTLTPTAYVNGVLYSAEVGTNPSLGVNYTQSYAVNPLSPTLTAVAENWPGTGLFYTGLTRDDVGGLSYLLATNNINYEFLLAGVQGVGTNSFVNGAWRPGVDKITFFPQPIGVTPGTFLPMTNQFTDTYITNGIAVQQQLQRVTTQPDFLFKAGNDSFCTGATNWINNAALNNNSTEAGPGNIQPPVFIVFQKMGNYFVNFNSYTPPFTWSEDSVQDFSSEAGTFGSFDDSTNAPIVYPAPQTGNVSMSVRVLLRHSNFGQEFRSFEWLPDSQAGTIYALQTSTNLSTWDTLFVVTNNGSVCTYQNVNANSPSRFYRLVPQ